MNNGLFGFPTKNLASNFNGFPKKGVVKESMFGFPYNIPGYIFQCTPNSDNYAFSIILTGNMGTNITIDWGDNTTTIVNFTGSAQTISHTFANQIPYSINFIGDTTVITAINCSGKRLYGILPQNMPQLFPYLTSFIINNNQLKGLLPNFNQCVYLKNLTLGTYVGQGNFFEGTFPDLSELVNLTDFYYGSGTIKDNIPNLSSAVGLKNFQIQGGMLGGNMFDCTNLTELTQLAIYALAAGVVVTGIAPNIANATKLTFISLPSCNFSGQNFPVIGSNLINTLSYQGCGFTGTFPSFLNNTVLTTFTIGNCSCTSLTDFPANKFTSVGAQNNALDSISVDLILHQLNVAFTASAPTANLSVSLNGGTNASPTGGNANTDIVSLNAIFATTTYLLTISIN